MEIPAPFVLLHDIGIPILALAALLLAFLYIIFETKESARAAPE